MVHDVPSSFLDIFYEVIGYFATLSCNVRPLQYLRGGENLFYSAFSRGLRVRIPRPTLEVHDGVLYHLRQRGTAPLASNISTEITRIHPTRVTSIPLIGSRVSIPAFKRGETDTPTRSTRVASPRASVVPRRLLEETAQPGARLHLIAVVPVRRELALFRRQERARVHGGAIPPVQPAIVCAAIRRRERRCMACFLVVESRHAGLDAISFSTGDVRLRHVVVRTTRGLRRVRVRSGEASGRSRGSWSGGSVSSSVVALLNEDRVGLPLIFSNVEGGPWRTCSLRSRSSDSLLCRFAVRQRQLSTSAVSCTLRRCDRRIVENSFFCCPGNRCTFSATAARVVVDSPRAK